ncbi:ABC transporter permease [Methanospirillum stamsii]|uniref:Uncharacterized protein n=1 Tax=Methanospirillum stamsii TaxID=1277351 RepID=A0A2V2NIY7_9EURY|nr:FtsX-like permease family protein [Methanospirillum stamsii]PWR76318.1 hypothetical protein DLD82_00480 [Methanospirillum stamsii]
MLTDFKISFFLAVRMLRRSSKTGTLLTIFIIAMVFTNMIFLSSVIGGSIELMNEQTVDFYISNIIIKPKEDIRFIDNTSSLVSKVNRIPGVSHASARYELGASLNHKSNEIALPVIAFNPDDEKLVTKIHEMMKEGQFLTREDRGQVIIGNYVAGNVDESKDFFESLGGVKTGDSITVSFVNGVSKDYRIKGIFQTKSYQTDYKVFISWNEMEEVLGYPLDQSNELLVKTEAGTTEKEVKRTMLSYGIQEQVKTWKEQAGGLFDESIESFQIINNITLIVSLIIAIIVLFIIIMIKTLHNKREIGVLKAIGIDEDIIIQSYVIQTLIIGILGITIGFCIIQTLIAYFLAYPIEFPDGNVSLYVETGIMIESAVLLIIASIIAGYLPASRIAKEEILTAMRG